MKTIFKLFHVARMILTIGLLLCVIRSVYQDDFARAAFDLLLALIISDYWKTQ